MASLKRSLWQQRFFKKSAARFWLTLFVLIGLLAACSQVTQPAPTPTQPATASFTLSPSATYSLVPDTATPTATATSSPSPSPAGPQGIWEDFPAPRLTPVTPIPPPLTGIVVPEEVRIVAVGGIDQPWPFSGRTDAIVLVIYHPRLSRASLVSIPPELFGYIPGYTMQRMYTAYAVGGPQQVISAIEYNLGVRPNDYAFLNTDIFINIIDYLEGINVSVLENVTGFCPSIQPGVVLMDGSKTLCYFRLRPDEDEFARNRRQQEVLRTIFMRLVESGNLVRLPELYDAFRFMVNTNLTRSQMIDGMPLALKLGDPSRTGFFQMSSKELSIWEISQQPLAKVYLPNRPALMVFMQQAVDFVTTPSPLRDIVVTLQYQMTISPTPTSTYTQTPTVTLTATPIPSFTPTLRTFTPTPTITGTRRTSTPTLGPTRTVTPSPTITSSPTYTLTSP